MFKSNGSFSDKNSLSKSSISSVSSVSSGSLFNRKPKNENTIHNYIDKDNNLQIKSIVATHNINTETGNIITEEGNILAEEGNIIAKDGNLIAGKNITVENEAYINNLNVKGNSNMNGYWKQIHEIKDSTCPIKLSYSLKICTNNAIIGAHLSNNSKGSVNIYNINKTTNRWYKINTIVPNNLQKHDFFGYSVDISNDYAIIGSYGYNSKRGKVYFYKKTSSNWELNTEITLEQCEINSCFGISVSIYNNYALVGAHKQYNKAWIVMDHRASPWIIMHHHGSSCIIMDHRASSCIVMHHHASSCIIMTHHD